MSLEPLLVGILAFAVCSLAARARRSGLERELAAVKAELRTASVASFTKDLRGRYVHVSEAAAERLGRPVAALVGRTDAESAQLPFAVAAACHDTLAHEGQVVTADEPAPSGSGTVRTTRAPHLDALGALDGVVGFFPERQSPSSARAAAVRARELERLRDLDLVRSQVLNTVTHELRTPLTPIKVHTHLLRASASDARSQRALDVIERNVERLDEVVSDLLEVARSEAHRPTSHVEIVDIADVVRSCASGAAERAEECGLRLETEAPAAVHVVGDARQLRQVVQNLLDNALKFTAVGGHVRVEVGTDGPQARIAVTDDGEGIDAADLAVLFRPFAQAHEAMQRTRSGAGLGLAMARATVARHGGAIWAESAGRGLGSRFAFVLPLAEAPQAEVRLVPKETRPALFRVRR